MSGLVIFLVALMIGGSQACRCPWQPLEERYCNSNYAILAEVTARDRPDPQTFFDVTYTVDVRAVFRDHSLNLGENFVHTASNSAACGVTLQIGSTYFLAGGGNLNLTSCWSIIINLANAGFQQYLDIISMVFNPQCNAINTVKVAVPAA